MCPAGQMVARCSYKEKCIGAELDLIYHEFLTSPSLIFGGTQRSFAEADYVILGVPFDLTSTYRSGSRFAPLAIRQASLNIESYSFRTNVDVENLKIHDVGDLHVAGEVGKTLESLEQITKDLVELRKKLVIIGGEHTITLGILRGIAEKVALVSFDAHLDLRDEYMGLKVSHATFMRRISERINTDRIIEIGTRAACMDELRYARKSGIQFFTTPQIMKEGIETTAKKINKLLADHERIYLTLDMDVLDPAFAPAVQNPEPDGLDTHILLDLLGRVIDNRIIAFDLVEVAPHYDNGITSIQAAKVIVEILCHIERAQATYHS